MSAFKSRRAVLLSAFAFSAIYLGVCGTSLASSSRDAAIQKLGLDKMDTPAPDLVFRDVTGAAKTIKSFQGKPAILHVWALWCEPCKKELPELEAVSRKIKALDIAFLPVAVDDGAKKTEIQTFLKKISPSLSPLMVKDDEQSRPYLAWGVPVTYFIAANGRIIARSRGSRSWSAVTEDDLRNIFRP